MRLGTPARPSIDDSSGLEESEVLAGPEAGGAGKEEDWTGASVRKSASGRGLISMGWVVVAAAAISMQV